MNTETTDRRSVLDLTIEGRRTQSEKVVADFHESIRKGDVASAIKWSGVEVIDAEQVVALLTRFEEIRDEDGLDRALEFAAARSDDATRQLGWYDPTSTSTSIASTMVDQAMYKAHRRIIEIAEELRESAAVDAEEDQR